MSLILSHQILDELLAGKSVKPNDLAAIDRLFGGEDGYYWYHTLRHLCPRGKVMVWASIDELRDDMQKFEDATALEDEVKPMKIQEGHVAAIGRHLSSMR